MKKNLFFGLCAASMLLMTSCDKEAFGGRFGEQETNVTLSVSLPELQTRAYGTGVNAKYLQYAVYSLDAQDAINEQIEKNSLVLTQLAKNELSIKLVPNTKYAIVLWADAYGADATSPFPVTMKKNDNGEFVNTLAVDATKIKTSDDNADAFFGSYEINVTGANQYTITDALNNTEISNNDLKLKRPFAQLNIASTISDYNTLVNSGFDLKKTKISVKKAYSSMNLLTGAVGDDQEITYAYSDALAAVNQDPAYNAHKLLSVNYILMSDSKQTATEVVFTYSNGTTEGYKSYYNVPLRRNWRTNIYGDLFTNKVGITVSIAPSFADQIDANGDGKADTENQYSGNNGNFSAYLP